MKIVDVNKDNFKKEVLESNIPVLVDFNADWCGPCRMLGNILNELSNEHDDFKIVSINIDDEEELASEYKVSSIPCLVLFNNGNLENRSVGLISKSEVEKFVGGK